MNYELLV